MADTVKASGVVCRRAKEPREPRLSAACSGGTSTLRNSQHARRRSGGQPPLARRRHAVGAPVDAETAEDAAFALVEIIVDVFPDARPSRLDQDLVSIPDIAGRVDRTRESVRLLVDGKRGPGSFPSPVGTVGDGIRIWPWAVVVEWFAEALGEEVDDPGVPPGVAAVIDASLVTRGGQELARHKAVV